MCARTLERLRYHSRNAALISKASLSSKSRHKTAMVVDSDSFTNAVAGCRHVQQSPNLVSFFRGDDLIAQGVWQEVEGETYLELRLFS